MTFFKRTSLYIIAIPILFMFLGAASNQIVLLANHDTFPVHVSQARIEDFTNDDAVNLPDGTVMLDKEHCLMTSKTHLNFLADVIDLKDRYVSIGDIGIEFGGYLWTFAPFIWGFAVVQELR